MQVFSLLRGLKEESLGVGLIMGAPKLKKKRKEKKRRRNKGERNLDPGQWAIGNWQHHLISFFPIPFSIKTNTREERK